jgi:hypothetical protein
MGDRPRSFFGYAQVRTKVNRKSRELPSDLEQFKTMVDL